MWVGRDKTLSDRTFTSDLSPLLCRLLIFLSFILTSDWALVLPESGLAPLPLAPPLLLGLATPAPGRTRVRPDESGARLVAGAAR